MKKLVKDLLKLVPESRSNYDRVIFLENSNGLHSDGAAECVRSILIENKVRHHIIYNLDDMTDNQLEEAAKSCLDSLVVYETTGTSKSFRKLIEIFIKLTNKGYRFRFIEASVYNFQFYRLPDEIGEGCLSYHNLECCPWSEIDEWNLEEVKKLN